MVGEPRLQHDRLSRIWLLTYYFYGIVGQMVMDCKVFIFHDGYSVAKYSCFKILIRAYSLIIRKINRGLLNFCYLEGMTNNFQTNTVYSDLL